MIVSEESIKDIIRALEVTDTQMVALLRQYIFEKKGIDIKIEVPKDPQNALLMHRLFEVVCSFYYKKFDS